MARPFSHPERPGEPSAVWSNARYPRRCPSLPGRRSARWPGQAARSLPGGAPGGSCSGLLRSPVGVYGHQGARCWRHEGTEVVGAPADGAELRRLEHAVPFDYLVVPEGSELARDTEGRTRYERVNARDPEPPLAIFRRLR